MRLILEKQQKYLQSFINNVTYQRVNLFISLSTLHPMKFRYNSKVWTYHCSMISKSAQHCLYNSGMVKIDVLDTYGAMICLYFGIVFLLLFKKIENAVDISFKNNILFFINGLIFDIINIQNYQSLKFEWVPTLAPFIRSVNDLRFSWLRNVFIKSFQIGWILFSNAKETLQKMLARKCSYRYRGKP